MKKQYPTRFLCPPLNWSMWVRCRVSMALGFAAITAGCVSQERLAYNSIHFNKFVPNRCLYSVTKLTDQALLAQVSVEAGDPRVRKAAVAKLTDQIPLAKVAVEAEDSDVRKAAVQQLTDPSLLAKIATEDKNWCVHQAAVSKLSYVRKTAVEKLTDQALLAKIAVEDEDGDVRKTAVEKLTDQALLAKIAVEDKYRDVRKTALEKLTDQALLAKVAVEAGHSDVRKTAVEKLTAQALLSKVAVEAGDSDVRRTAVEKLTDQALLAKVAVEDKDSDVRRTAVEKLTDQALLAKVAVNEDENTEIRVAAVEKLTDQALLIRIIALKDRYGGTLLNIPIAALKQLTDHTLLAKIAVEEKSWFFRVTAAAKLPNQTLLLQWAESDPRAAFREYVVARIDNDDFLVNRLRLDPSASVRSAIVNTLRGQSALRKAALTAYHVADRSHATDRLAELSESEAAAVRTAHQDLHKQAASLGTGSSQESLSNLAVKGEFDVLRIAAARALRDPAVIETTALQADDPVVLRILLAAISDNPALDRIAKHATARAMRLAAARKSGSRSWDAIFRSASEHSASMRDMGDAVAAVALFEAKQSDAVASVQQACLTMIRKGDESRIPEMAELLEEYGDKRLAEDYLNCGQPDLDTAGRNWGRRRGLDVGRGGGSSRARWGGSK